MASSSSSARPSVDRVRTCPLLLRVFVNVGRHHHPDEYRARSTPRGGLDVYTWRDATLRELAEEVKAAVEAARDSRARLDFALVYPNAQGLPVLKDVGSVRSAGSGDGPADGLTLADIKHQTGDYLDVAVVLPPGGGGGRGDRDRG